MADLFAEFATLTLGSGAAAMVMGRHSDNPGSHKVVGGISQADTSHHKICVGTLDQMRTDTKALLDAGLHAGQEAWAEVDARGEGLARDGPLHHPPGVTGAHVHDVSTCSESTWRRRP